MKRIQRKRVRGWRLPEGAVYVGRPSLLGNPFTRMYTTKKALALYRQAMLGGWSPGILDGESDWLVEQAYRITLAWRARIAPMGHVYENIRFHLLDATALACWCRLCDEHAEGKPAGVVCDACQPCHADVLLELLEATA